MKLKATLAGRILVIYLCSIPFLSLLPAPLAHAQNKAQKKVQIQLGKPSVWSIGQAHYLLANMRQVNRALRTHMPSETELNPSATNATRIQILRTLLDVEGQFSQKAGI